MAGDTIDRDVGDAIQIAQRVTKFWALVDHSGGPQACWAWTGYQEGGYGRFRWRGRMVGAHELAVTFTTGEQRLASLDTCHSRECVTTLCCNPGHLRFDTRLSNVADAVALGHYHRPPKKISDADVHEMRLRRASGAAQRDLAAAYGVSEAYVSQIVNGISRRDAGGPILPVRKYFKKAC